MFDEPATETCKHSGPTLKMSHSCNPWRTSCCQQSLRRTLSTTQSKYWKHSNSKGIWSLQIPLRQHTWGRTAGREENASPSQNPGNYSDCSPWDTEKIWEFLGLEDLLALDTQVCWVGQAIIRSAWGTEKLSLVSNRETGLWELKQPLVLVSSSSLPDIAEEFQLFVNERKCIVPDPNTKTKTMAMSCWRVLSSSSNRMTRMTVGYSHHGSPKTESEQPDSGVSCLDHSPTSGKVTWGRLHTNVWLALL